MAHNESQENLISRLDKELPAEPQPAITRDSDDEYQSDLAIALRLGQPAEVSPIEKSPVVERAASPSDLQTLTALEPVELEAEPVGATVGSHFDYSDDEDGSRSPEERKQRDSMQEKRSTKRDSNEIKVALRVSTLDQERKKGLQPTMFTMHPLQLAPVSQTAPILQMPRMPKRPARPLSLRLSAAPRRGGLTTSRVLVVDPDRQKTSDSYSTQPHTGYITAAPKGAPIKYGRGKYAACELIPQPSDDPQDPLNWQTWRKDLHFYSLLVTVALCNVMKTALISVNGPLALTLGVSYTAVTALTGVPLMLSALTGLASSAMSKMWGRRPVYLVSMVLLFIGVVWNAAAKTSYGNFMMARIFQGFGWGAFDTIVAGSIMDVHFEHERSTRLAIYRIVSVATLWGSPLFGGLVVQHPLGADYQFAILSVFQILSVPLLILGVPETMYDRVSNMFEKPSPGWTPRTGWSSIGLKSSSRFRRLPAWARGRGLTLDRAIQYVKDVAPPVTYRGTSSSDVIIDRVLLMQALRAAVTPTAVLSFLTSFLPFALLWGSTASLSGLFSRAPYNLFPATIGSLLATPFILSTFSVALFTLWSGWSKTGAAFRIHSTYPLVLAAGATLSFVGLLAWGLYVVSRSHTTDEGFRFSALSFVLGLLAAGAHVLDAPTKLLVRRSAQFTSPNLYVGLRAKQDMEAGVAAWRALFAGVFAMGIPAAVVASDAGLKSTAVGVAVVQVFVVAGVGAAWYLYEDDIKRLDGRVLACVDLTASLRSPRSFFDA